MKIVHITTVHQPFDNRIFHKECTSMVELGYDVVLIACHDENETFQGVKIRALPKPGGRLARLFKTTSQAYKLALEEKADIYHFHDPEFIPFAMMLARRGKNVIYDVHEDYLSSVKQKSYLPGLVRNMLAYVVAFLETKITGSFARVLAEKYYKQRFPDGVQVLNYPKRNLLSLAINKVERDDVHLIYTGNITRDRGAYQHVNILNYCHDAQLNLIGYCREELANQLYVLAGDNKDRLQIHGIGRYIPFEEIISCYAEGNWTAGLALFPLTPHYVNKELTKIFEYMSVGIPIICSDFPAWKELMEKTGAGICVNADSEKEVKAAIDYLHQNREQAKKMGENGRRSVDEYYNWENEVKKLEALYIKLGRK